MVRTRIQIGASGTPRSSSTNVPVTPPRLQRTNGTRDLTNLMENDTTPIILFPELVTPPKTKKNTHNEHEGPYIGLKQMALINALHANRRWDTYCSESWKRAILYEHCNKALEQWNIARTIDPGNEYVNNEAIAYEELGRYDIAEQLYLKAIEYSDDVLSMYNLADLYESGKLGNEKKSHAIQYYEMGADHNDPASITKSVLYYGNQDSSCLNVLKLGKYYVKLTQQDGTCGFHRDTSEYDELMEFMDSNPGLLIIKRLEKVYECPVRSLSFKAKEYLDILCKSQAYLSYKNKMELFTRLNNVTQCPICYEDKINIDISCGHTFCGDCYARIYTSVCPLCRVPCCLNDYIISNTQI